QADRPRPRGDRRRWAARSAGCARAARLIPALHRQAAIAPHSPRTRFPLRFPDASKPMTRPAAAVPYAPAIDAPDPRERAAIEDLKDVFADMAATVARHEGHAYRAVHAKGHALLEARFEVRGDLPAELAHGLFARPGHYRALARLSSPPAEQLPDTMSTPRAIALKVLEVPGARVETGDGATSQDFLMVNAPAFSAPDPAGFLRAARLLAATTERMPRTKEAISSTLRGASALLDRAG